MTVILIMVMLNTFFYKLLSSVIDSNGGQTSPDVLVEEDVLPDSGSPVENMDKVDWDISEEKGVQKASSYTGMKKYDEDFVVLVYVLIGKTVSVALTELNQLVKRFDQESTKERVQPCDEDGYQPHGRSDGHKEDCQEFERQSFFYPDSQ